MKGTACIGNLYNTIRFGAAGYINGKCVDTAPAPLEGLYIEDLFLRPAVKKAIILLLSRGHIKVLKNALAHSGPYQTLM